jgi:hypothetical protein
MIAINDQYVHKVADAREHDAENALVNDSTVALDMSAAQRYVTEILPAAPGKSYYLVRGCYYNENTGRYSVSSVGEVLVVSHVNLGTSTSPPKKRALLVALEGPAAQVYVGCATAR